MEHHKRGFKRAPDGRYNRPVSARRILEDLGSISDRQVIREMIEASSKTKTN